MINFNWCQATEQELQYSKNKPVEQYGDGSHADRIVTDF